MYEGVVELIQPCLKRHRVSGYIELKTVNQQIYLYCCTGDMGADTVINNLLEASQATFIQFTFKG